MSTRALSPAGAPGPRTPVLPSGFRVVRIAFATSGRLTPRATGQAACWLFTHPPRHRTPPRERAWVASSRPARVAGLAGIELGAGPTVVLLHGWGGRASQMGAFLAPLAATGHRAVSLSLPAHGKSRGFLTDPVDTARALQEAVAELGAPRAVVAHSFAAAATGIALSGGLPAEKVVLLAAPSSLEQILDDFAVQTALPTGAAQAFRHAAERRTGANPRNLGLTALAPTKGLPRQSYLKPAFRDRWFR